MRSAEIRGEERVADGAARLAARAQDAGGRAREFETALGKALAALEARVGEKVGNLPVVVSGMATSTIGWREVPYARLPFRLDGSDAVVEPSGRSPGGGRVYLVSGVRTDTDVMRGEETQIIGLHRLGVDLAARAVVILPGTHSKHVFVEGDRMTDFRTCMTGELFGLLVEHSVLRHSVAAPEGRADNAAIDDMDAFRDGVRHAAGSGLLPALFRTRTRQVLDGRDPASNRAFLDGLLIGSELIDLQHRGGGAGKVLVCGGDDIAPLYVAALETFGAAARTAVLGEPDVHRLAILGHEALLERITREEPEEEHGRSV